MFIVVIDMGKKGIKAVRIISAILLIAMMVVIYIFSSQNDMESSKTSGDFIEFLLSIFYPPFKNLSGAGKLEFIAPLQAVIRNAAHFSIYFVLGIFSFFTFITYNGISLKLRLIIISMVCLLYSISDEIHQTFVPGRYGDIRDVCLDFCGSLLSIIILALILKARKNKKNNKGGAVMNKKELFKINQDLFAKNQQLMADVNNLEKMIEALKSEKEELARRLDELDSKENSTMPLKNLENKVAAQANLTEETKYGSYVIGQIVVAAAKHCNNLTSMANREMTKELVNLILGRTEIAKSEVLKIVSSDASLEEKKSLIDSQKKDAEDYFRSVIAQTDN